MNWKTWLGVAGVIVIVALVAIPQYADYTHRSQASEAVLLLGAAKTPLAEYFADHQKWPAKVLSETQGKYTESVVISKGANGAGDLELTATMKKEGVDRRVTGQSVLLTTKDGGRTWVCSPGTMAVSNLPASCRP